MTVLFDVHSGRLRLDQDAAGALLAWARGAEPGPAMTELHDAGVILEGRPHPALEEGLKALNEPVCGLELALQTSTGERRTGSGWVAVDAAALLMDLPDDGMRELITVHPTFLPAGLARVVRLGPRRRTGSEPLHLPSHVFDALLVGDPTTRARAADDLGGGGVDPDTQAAVRALSSRPWRRWHVNVSWRAAPGRPGGRSLSVLDTPDAGMWWMEPAHDSTVLWPCTPTSVWRALTVLLPADEDLG